MLGDWPIPYPHRRPIIGRGDVDDGNCAANAAARTTPVGMVGKNLARTKNPAHHCDVPVAHRAGAFEYENGTRGRHRPALKAALGVFPPHPGITSDGQPRGRFGKVDTLDIEGASRNRG